MLGVVFALVAACAFAAGNVFGRVGLEYVRATGGVLVSLVASLVLLLLVTLVFDLQALLAIPLAAAAWFATAGILNFPIGRYFKFLGIRHSDRNPNHQHNPSPDHPAGLRLPPGDGTGHPPGNHGGRPRGGRSDFDL
ncbi:MAG: hypothetical protein Q8O86_05435, partial [Dehalococcoidia bacterium]|nr:hypothetical protein [Dehalococcoidia bacterium]